jgi:hypothetical protein
MTAASVVTGGGSWSVPQLDLCGVSQGRTIPMPQSPDLTLPLAQPITLSRGPGAHLYYPYGCGDPDPGPGAGRAGRALWVQELPNRPHMVRKP